MTFHTWSREPLCGLNIYIYYVELYQNSGRDFTWLQLVYPSGFLTVPSGHMTSIQRRLIVDATSWCCIDVETTLYKRNVPAGTIPRRFLYCSPSLSHVCDIICGVCDVFICTSPLLLLVPREGWTSWLWHFLGISLIFLYNASVGNFMRWNPKLYSRTQNVEGLVGVYLPRADVALRKHAYTNILKISPPKT